MSDAQPRTAPIEAVLQTLATEYQTPDGAVAACAARVEEAAPALLALLNRAADRGLSQERDRVLLFRAVHILGAARYEAACQPLLRLLRRPVEEVEAILGDAVTETLPKIVAGVFDGNAQALFTAAGDRRVDEAARWSLLSAIAFLTFTGRIDGAATRDFMRRFHAEKRAAPLDSAWIGWGDAIAVLGYAELAPLVEQVWATFPPEIGDLRHFREALADAQAAPADESRLDTLSSGYFEDAVRAFDWVRRADASQEEDWEAPPPPVENPLRHVGRNDPCPCGSGKKYKKCCLNA